MDGMGWGWKEKRGKRTCRSCCALDQSGNEMNRTGLNRSEGDLLPYTGSFDPGSEVVWALGLGLLEEGVP